MGLWAKKWALDLQFNDIELSGYFKHLKSICKENNLREFYFKFLHRFIVLFDQIHYVGGEEWKLLAERVGLNSERIRFLDKRYPNPAGALLEYVGKDMTVGNLYDLLNECGLPALADRL